MNYPSEQAGGVVQPKTPSAEERHVLREAVKVHIACAIPSLA